MLKSFFTLTMIISIKKTQKVKTKMSIIESKEMKNKSIMLFIHVTRKRRRDLTRAWKLSSSRKPRALRRDFPRSLGVNSQMCKIKAKI